MAEENDKKSPSADEIVDELAADMGVEDAALPEDDAMSDLGGIFNVSSSGSGSKKKKKSKKQSKKDKLKAALEREKKRKGQEEKPADEAEAPSAEPPKASEKSSSKKASASAVGGVFNPASANDDVDLSDVYLDDDDLGEFSTKGPSTSSLVMGGVIVVLLGVIGALVFQFTDVGQRLYWLMTGQLEAREFQKAQDEAERQYQEALAALPKYGALSIEGTPAYATLKLNGEIQYGQTSSGEWKELRLRTPTVFNGLKIDEKVELAVHAPGHQPETFNLTEGMWDGEPENPTGYRKSLRVTLLPETGERQLEYQQRLESDIDNDYYGTLKINTSPSGAYVILNNRLMRDEDGAPLTTPIETDKYWAAKDLVGSEDDDQKDGQAKAAPAPNGDLVPQMLARQVSKSDLEEKEIRVDTPLDRGNKLQVRVPESQGEFPNYVTALERQMWTCDWTDGEIPKESPYPKGCDYSFTLDLDFNGLKSYIERREEEKREIMEKNAKAQAAAQNAGGGEAGAEPPTE